MTTQKTSTVTQLFSPAGALFGIQTRPNELPTLCTSPRVQVKLSYRIFRNDGPLSLTKKSSSITDLICTDIQSCEKRNQWVNGTVCKYGRVGMQGSILPGGARLISR